MIQHRAEPPSSPDRPPTAPVFERVGGWMACATSAIAFGIALFAFGTWSWWKDWKIGAADNTIPMAPSTALVFMGVGAALLLRQVFSKKAVTDWLALVAAAVAVTPGLLELFQQITGIALPSQAGLFASHEMVHGIPIGRMSPLTATTFALSGVCFAALAPPFATHRAFLRVALVVASVGELAGLIIALAYVSGTPLFYDGQIIPMAFLTATAFAALFVGLLTALALAGRERAEQAGVRIPYAKTPWPDTERHLLIVIGVLALGILLAGLFSLRAQQAAMRERIAGELQAIVDLKVEQIVNWRNERLDDARLLMVTPYLARSAVALGAEPDSGPASAEMFAYIQALQRNYRYDAVVAFDQQMNRRLAVPARAPTSGPRVRALLEAAPQATDVLVSDLHRGADDDIYMDIVAPLRDMPAALPDSSAPQASGPLAGAILLRIDPRDFLYPLIHRWPVPSKTGETLLVRREGNEVVYLNELHYKPGNVLTMRSLIDTPHLPEAMGALGQFGVSEGVDYRGVAVLAAVRAVPGTPWILIAKEDQAEIYAPLRRQGFAASATVLSLLLGAALGVAQLARRTTANFLGRQLATETERRSLAERLALITQHANDIIVLADETGRILEANDRALTTYGYALEELRRLPTGGLRAPGHEGDPASQRALFDSSDGAIFETVHQRKDGTTFPVEVSGRTVEVNGRKVRLGIFRDITERKRAEEARHESDRRFREMMENLNLIAVMLDARGVVTFCNDFLLRLLDRQRDEVVGQEWFAHFLPKGNDAAKRIFLKAIARGRIPAHFQNPIKLRSGEIRQIAWNNMVLRDAAGSIVGTASIGEDVTDRRRAEAALRQSEERYRLLFDDNPLPMWVYDVETLQFLAVNASAINHYGFSRAEFLAMSMREIRPPEDIAGLEKTIAAQGADTHGTLAARHRRKDGTIISVEVISRPIVFDGRKAGLVLASDVTEKKQLQEQFLHAQRLENIGLLAAGIAHDLNNVLAPIVFAAPLLRDSVSSPRDVQMLDTLEECAGRGTALVKQILSFVHRTTSDFSATQVKHLARDVLSVMRETFPKAIQIEQNIAANLWLVHGNPTQIHQVLLNLCVNARDAMPHGGILRLAAANRHLDSEEAAKIPGGRPGAWLVLEVTDTGTGIAPDVLSHIWTPFFTTKGVGKGTGLGLSTVLGIVINHQGFVEVSTAVGRGTTFRVFLPAVETAPAETITAPVADARPGHGELILVVDDDAAVRQIVCTVLRKNGYRVVSCVDGMDGITAFGLRRSEISLVLTDVDMPRLGGVALTQGILRLQPDTPVLATSGLPRDEAAESDIAQIIRLAQAFLPKPFAPKDLLATVQRLLQPAVRN